jgi:hypothetical protein
VACFLAGTETLLAKANAVGSHSRARIPTGHGRDTSNLSKCKSLILLALPRGPPVFAVRGRLQRGLLARDVLTGL